MITCAGKPNRTARKIVAEQKKEIELLREAGNEKEKQIEAQEVAIEKYENAINAFKEETNKTGENAQSYLIIYSGLILSLIGNFISWVKFLIGRKRIKLEESILDIDYKIKQKEFEELNRKSQAEQQH